LVIFLAAFLSFFLCALAPLREDFSPIKMRRSTFVWVVLCALAGPASAAETPIAEPVAGDPWAAEITAVDSQGQITFSAGAMHRTLPIAGLLRWGHPAEVTRGPVLLLADGGLIVADGIQLDKSTLQAHADLLGPLKLPLELVAGAVLQLPIDRPRRDRLLDRVAAGAERSDRLLLANGDEIRGTLQGVDDERVRVQADVGPLAIELDRVAAFVLRTPAAPPTAPRPAIAWTGLADGSRLRAARLVVDPAAGTLRVTLGSGAELSAAAGKLTWIQPSGGRAVYLSDLRADGYRHVPFLSLAWPYRVDRSVQNGWLRCGGQLYAKGLGVHSASRLTYLLDGSYGRFQAELGVDDETAGGGSVRFRVFLDGQPKFTSEIVRGAAPPRPIAVDITGGKRLDLVVDFADRADELDHADWLNARIVPSKP
jgi:hypothetical protein